MNPTEIDIIMADGSTRREAEIHLKNGSIVIDDFEENFDKYMNDWNIDEDDRQLYVNMIATKKPIRDWGIVTHNGNTYYIMYVL